MDFATMMGMAGPGPTEANSMPPIANFSSTFAPVPPEVQAMAVPAANSQEVEQRKAGWLTAMEKVANNPNLMRALGMAGATLAQPKPIGQTNAGMLGKSFMVGSSAYQAGEYADRRHQLEVEESKRREKVTDASVKASDSTTELNKARLPGVVADSALTAGTVQTKIDLLKTELGSKVTRAATEQNAAKTAALEEEFKRRKLELAKSIPDAKIRGAMEAEYDLAIEKLAAAKANTAATIEGTAGKKVDREKDTITLDVLRGMTPDEQKEFLTKTGRYSTHTSGISQQATMWGAIYDKLPPDDAHKKGKTREQFQMEQLKSGKAADVAKQMADYVKAMDIANRDPDPDVLSSFNELIKATVGARTGQAPTPKPGTTPAGAKTGRAEPKSGQPGANAKWTKSADGTVESTEVNGVIHIRPAPVQATPH